MVDAPIQAVEAPVALRPAARGLCEASHGDRVEIADRNPTAGWRSRPRVQQADAAPDTVDLRLTGACQLRCPFCWGPEHRRSGAVTPDQWVETIGRLAGVGTTQIVLSGGEPTLSKSLEACVTAAKRHGMSVTLSTNGINLARFDAVLRLIDDLGIPLDGSTPDMNERMRTRSRVHDAWRHALGAMLLIQEMHRAGRSAAMLTVRTVIARPNLNDVPAIPAALAASGVDLTQLRLKLYQVEPFGPHFGDIDFDRDWAVTDEEAEEAFHSIRARNPELHAELQLYAGTVGRYFLVDPDGYATGTDESPDGAPIEVPYGDLVRDFSGSIGSFLSHQREIVGRSDPGDGDPPDTAAPPLAA